MGSIALLMLILPLLCTSHLTSEEKFKLRSSIEVEDINDRLQDFLNKEDIYDKLYREATGMAVPTVKDLNKPPPSMTGIDFKRLQSKMREYGRKRQNKRPRVPVPGTPILPPSPPSKLEIALKKLEILSTEAGFDLSELPRRSQLQVLYKLASKLPYSMAKVIMDGLRSRDDKVMQEFFAHLPEPKRDPLLEDDTEFLREYIKTITPESDPKWPSEEKISYSSYHEDNRPQLPSFYEPNDDWIPGLPRDHHNQSPPRIRAPFYSSQGNSGWSSSPPKKVENSGWLHSPSEGELGVGSEWAEGTGGWVTDPTGDPFPMGSEEKKVFVKKPEKNREKIHHPKHHSKTSSEKPGKIRFEESDTKSVLDFGPGEEETITVLKELPKSEKSVVPKKENPHKKKVFTKLIDIEPIYPSLNFTIVNKTRSNVVVRIPATSDDPFELTEDEIKATISEIKKLKLDYKYSLAVNETNTNNKKDTKSEAKELQKDAELEAQKMEKVETSESKKSEVVITAEQSTKQEEKVTEKEEIPAKSEKPEEEKKEGKKPHPLEFPDHPQHDDFAEEERQFKAYLQEVLADMMKEEDAKPSVPPVFQKQPATGHPKQPPVSANGVRGNWRPPPQHPPAIRPRPALGPAPIPGLGPIVHTQPLKINEVKGVDPTTLNVECDHFSEGICLVAKNYPVSEIDETLTSHPALASRLLVPENEEATFAKQGKAELKNEGGFLCPSKVAYGRVKKAKSESTNKWKWIVNHDKFRQTLRMEKCLSEGSSCSYVMPFYRTSCTQVYNYHRLLAWDKVNGIHMDLFKIPTCCTCHVQGFYMKDKNPNAMLRRRAPALGPRWRSRRIFGPPFPEDEAAHNEELFFRRRRNLRAVRRMNFHRRINDHHRWPLMPPRSPFGRSNRLFKRGPAGPFRFPFGKQFKGPLENMASRSFTETKVEKPEKGTTSKKIDFTKILQKYRKIQAMRKLHNKKKKKRRAERNLLKMIPQLEPSRIPNHKLRQLRTLYDSLVAESNLNKEKSSVKTVVNKTSRRGLIQWVRNLFN